jgi:hypothetical protein
MSQTIILTGNNWDASQSAFVYKFANGAPYKLLNKEVALSTCNIYNSFFNISAALGNNQIQLIFSGTTYTYTFPDGFYSASDMNYFLQSQMITNGLYCVNSTGQNVYFAEIVANSTAYSINLNLYVIPTSSGATTLGYTQGSGASWTYPVSTTANNIPQLTIMSAGFGGLIGFNTGTYPATSSASVSQQFASSSTPEISLVQSLILTCNMVNNIGFSNPADVLGSVPVNVAYGQMVSYNASTPLFQKASNNMYQSVVIRLYDQNLNLIKPLDLDVLILLSLRDSQKGQQ